ncbi:hypothetical protein [Pseudoduganella aquatica]|uniref:Uncharacterized protein n=1 Tax=Pseudoduganella aquatica TaxID=2660641 RepID=A0A7X4KP66_9BURK|nr:hypothetical protein [Pseudoduganella aquatica]MYN09912.1 hypothetical protein [Pseudoduganella aquatica]
MHIRTGTGAGASRADGGMDSGSRIAMLKSQIKVLGKKIEALRKALMETEDPTARLAIMKEIIELQDMQRMAQAQITELELRARRKLEQGRQDAPPEDEPAQ